MTASGIPHIIRLIKEQSGREPDFELNGQQFLARLWSKPNGLPPRAP